MRVVLVMDCAWQHLGVLADAVEADGHEAIPFNSSLRALDYCGQAATWLDVAFINLNNSGPGAGLWLADRIARARPGLPVAVTSFVFRTVPSTMPGTIRLWPKPVTRQILRDAIEGREPAPLPEITLRLLH